MGDDEQDNQNNDNGQNNEYDNSLDAVPPLTTPTAPTANPVAPTPTTPAPERRRKVLILTAVILLFICLAFAAAAIVYLRQPKASTANTSAPTSSSSSQGTTPSTQASLTAAELVKKVRSAVQDNLSAAYPKLTITDSTVTPAYKPSTSQYAIFSQTGGYSISVETGETDSSYEASNAATAEINKTITSALLAQTSFTTTNEGLWTLYTNDTVVCGTVEMGDLSCSDLSFYTAQANKLAPFFTAFSASNERDKAHAAMGDLEIKTGPNGYSTATITIQNTDSLVGGYAGLFYAKNGTWTYWLGTQGELLCSDYNTHDLQEAYQGSACVDGTVDSTVR